MTRLWGSKRTLHALLKEEVAFSTKMSRVLYAISQDHPGMVDAYVQRLGMGDTMVNYAEIKPGDTVVLERTCNNVKTTVEFVVLSFDMASEEGPSIFSPDDGRFYLVRGVDDAHSRRWHVKEHRPAPVAEPQNVWAVVRIFSPSSIMGTSYVRDEYGYWVRLYTGEQNKWNIITERADKIEVIRD